MLKMLKTLLNNAYKPESFKPSCWENVLHLFSVNIARIFYTVSYCKLWLTAFMKVGTA